MLKVATPAASSVPVPMRMPPSRKNDTVPWGMSVFGACGLTMLVTVAVKMMFWPKTGDWTDAAMVVVVPAGATMIGERARVGRVEDDLAVLVNAAVGDADRVAAEEKRVGLRRVEGGDAIDDRRDESRRRRG